jgi:hypothetical protein
MPLFTTQKPPAPPAPEFPSVPLDLSLSYDIYVNTGFENRLYENVKIIGHRAFPGMFGGYLEIEAANGARMTIPPFGIELVCQHGVQPVFKVLRRTVTQVIPNPSLGETSA